MHCTASLNGEACLVEGSTWVLKEDLFGEPSFSAPRPPIATYIPNIAKALQKDILYRLPSYYERGAGKSNEHSYLLQTNFSQLIHNCFKKVTLTSVVKCLRSYQEFF